MERATLALIMTSASAQLASRLVKDVVFAMVRRAARRFAFLAAKVRLVACAGSRRQER